MTTILFHAQDNAELEQQLEDALALGRASEGHVSCVHVTPAEAYVTFDAFGGVFVMDKVMSAVVEIEERVRQRVETALSNEDVPWDFQQIGGPVASALAGRAALADLIVVSRGRARSPGFGSPMAMTGDLLDVTRTPLFVGGEGAGVHDPFAPAVIGWNGSFEAANAVRGALSWLRLARSVTVVTVAEPVRDVRDEPMFPSTRLLEYLSRHGVHAELSNFDEPRSMVAPLLLEEVGARGAGTLVIGGYGRSRIGEYLLGGVTRDLLESCPVGMIVAH